MIFLNVLLNLDDAKSWVLLILFYYKWEGVPAVVQWVKDPAGIATAVGWIWSLAGELPYIVGVAEKEKNACFELIKPQWY